MSKAWEPRDDHRGINRSIHPRAEMHTPKVNTAKPTRRQKRRLELEAKRKAQQQGR